MNNFRVIALLLSMSLGHISLGQLDPLHTLYHANQYLINPAFGGLYESSSVSLNSRAQWYGLEGAPFTNTITLEGSLSDYAGIGFKVMNDRIGMWNNTEFMASSSYFIKSHFVKFGVAIQGGVTAISSDLSRLDPKVLNDPELDRVISNSVQPNFGVGFVLHRFDYFFAASIPRILKTSGITEGLNDPRYDRHIYLATGYRFSMFQSKDTKLQTMVRLLGDRFSFDLTGTYYFTDFLSIGGTLRDYYGASFFGRVNFDKNFSVSYSFELPTNNMIFTNHGTHEITLSYVFSPIYGQEPMDRIF